MAFTLLPTNNILLASAQEILVIGYGNDLRNDDAVGQRVAALVVDWHLPNVHAIAVRQLTPEMAELLATVSLVIFVDVYPANEVESDVQIQQIDNTDVIGSMSHMGNPRSLLALTRALYGRVPQAFWVMVPGVNFEVKIALSPVAEQGVEVALQKIDHLIQSVRTAPCMKLA
jgi:hydrogenase maturation protease